MARRVFFSFHFENDIWRVNQIRMTNLAFGVERAGFFDHSEYEKARLQGDAFVRRAIEQRLLNTSVTVVLIGSETAYRPYVQYEIAKSAERLNGFVGINIHHLKSWDGTTSPRGPIPKVPAYFPIYDWDGDVDRFRRYIEAAGRRSDAAKEWF